MGENPDSIEFVWDIAKAGSNLAKHGVAFEIAAQVWDDPFFELMFDRFEDGEERWHAIGIVNAFTILVVVHTYPGSNTIRIISARKATRHEKSLYEHGLP